MLRLPSLNFSKNWGLVKDRFVSESVLGPSSNIFYYFQSWQRINSTKIKFKNDRGNF